MVGQRARVAVGVVALTLLLEGCGIGEPREFGATTPSSRPSDGIVDEGDEPDTVTLAFAGDVHFEDQLAAQLDDPAASLGPMSQPLREADFAMINLESALASGGERTSKELEEPTERYWFRSPPEALGILARSGVDAVSVANNHGADYGEEGLRETIRTADRSPVAVVGVGDSPEQAFAPHRVSASSIDVAVLAADASPRESADAIWAVGDGGPGIASARDPRALIEATRDADRAGDVVVVYLHWGTELATCPNPDQRDLAASLAEAGADVVVGSHAHVLQGAGMLDNTYIAYGLGGLQWYHGARPETGVLQLRVAADGRVIEDGLVPGLIPDEGGAAQPVTDARGRASALADWRALRGCTDLEQAPGEGREGSSSLTDDDPPDFPEYAPAIRVIGDEVGRRMIGNGHDPDSCPVPPSDLRHLTVPYVGFDGQAHIGEMVIHADHATDVVEVFRKLYDERWPIQQMKLVSDYGGDDNRSMAANNTSGYNCRQVAGQDNWSDHAYGRAIDINPVQNPYLTGSDILPPGGRRYADADRARSASPGPGVIHRGDVVISAFDRAGWTWGGAWNPPDYQHFSAP